MTQVIDNTVAVIDNTTQIVSLYNTESIHDFMEATIKVKGNFQQYITDIIDTSNASILIDYTNEIFEEFGSKDFNNRMSTLRRQISRACDSLDMDIYTIKKVDGVFRFVLAKKQAVIEPDTAPENDDSLPENETDTPDNLMGEASTLMAKFMASRSIDDAAKVTEFMMANIK